MIRLLRQSYYDAPSVFEDPLDSGTIEGYELPVQFGVELYDDQQEPEEARKFYLRVFLAAVLGMIPARAMAGVGGDFDLPFPPLVALIVICLLFLWLGPYLKTHTSWLAAVGFVISVVMRIGLCLAVALGPQMWRTVVAALMLFQLCRGFVKHYRTVCAGGLLTLRERRTFICWGWLTTPVESAGYISGFVDALKSFAVYNRKELTHPGLIQSPLRSVGRRFVIAASTAFALTHLVKGILLPCLLGAATAEVSEANAMPALALCIASWIATPVAAVGVLTLSLFVYGESSYGRGLALKRTVFSPHRWEAFLDSLSFRKGDWA